MSARQIWEEYRAKACVPVETRHEIALQKVAFLAGLIRACGGIALGENPREMLAGHEELVEEGRRDLFLEADR